MEQLKERSGPLVLGMLETGKRTRNVDLEFNTILMVTNMK